MMRVNSKKRKKNRPYLVLCPLSPRSKARSDLIRRLGVPGAILFGSLADDAAGQEGDDIQTRNLSERRSAISSRDGVPCLEGRCLLFTLPTPFKSG